MDKPSFFFWCFGFALALRERLLLPFECLDSTFGSPSTLSNNRSNIRKTKSMWSRERSHKQESRAKRCKSLIGYLRQFMKNLTGTWRYWLKRRLINWYSTKFKNVIYILDDNNMAKIMRRTITVNTVFALVYLWEARQVWILYENKTS